MSASVDDLDALLGDLEKTCQNQRNSLSPNRTSPDDGTSNGSLERPKEDRSNNLNELDNLLMDLSKAKVSKSGPQQLIPNKTKETEALMREMQSSPKIIEKAIIEHTTTTVTTSTTEEQNCIDSKWAYKGYGIWESSDEPNTPNFQNQINYQKSVQEKHTNISRSEVEKDNVIQPSAASSATQELDDLMSSLNTFKIQGVANPETNNATSSQANTNLDDMLGNLQENLDKQGVKIASKGACGACLKPIAGQVITALGKTWHPEHFVCHHCNKELGTQNFFERDGKSYCEDDYHRIFSPRCGLCKEAILDKCVSAMDKTWHPECFVCFECKSGFGDDGFQEKDDMAYCKNCFLELFAPKCGGCQEPITENYISSLDQQWHQNCFVCTDCKEPFLGGNYFEHNGMPYCETHFHALRGSLCAGCQKPISGRCITAMFKKFHPEHFVCSFCLKQLNKGTFKERQDKPYCHECHDRLFG